MNDNDSHSSTPSSALVVLPQGKESDGPPGERTHTVRYICLMRACYFFPLLPSHIDTLEEAALEECSSMDSPLIPESFDYFDPMVGRFHPNETLR